MAYTFFTSVWTDKNYSCVVSFLLTSNKQTRIIGLAVMVSKRVNFVLQSFFDGKV